jgi:ABC-type glycerol-3-phosphate transport system substrate-binding protein
MKKRWLKIGICVAAVFVLAVFTLPLFAGGKEEPPAVEAEEMAVELKPWEKIDWNKPRSWPERLLADKYILPEGWEEAVEGVEKISFYNIGGIETDIATKMNMMRFEELTGIEIEAIPLAPAFVLSKTLSTLVAKDKAIHGVGMNNPSYNFTPIAVYLQDVDHMWPSEIKAMYNENLDNYLAWDGHWYAMPVAAVGHLNFYRKSWFEQAGVEVPTSMVEFAEAAKKVNKWAQENLGPDYYGIVFSVPSTELFTRYRELMYAQDQPVIGANGRLNFHSKEALNAFNWLVDMFREGLITEDALSFGWMDAANFFGVGKAATITDAPAMFYGFFQSQYPEVGQDMGALTNLKWSEDDPDEWNGRSLIGANSIGLPKYIDDNHKAAVMLFFDYVRSLEGQRNEAIVEGNASFLLHLWETLDEQFAKVDWDLADAAAEELEINPPVRRTEAGPMIKGNAIQSEKSLLEVFPPYFPEVQNKFNEVFANVATGKMSSEDAMKEVQELADTFR